MHLIDTRAMIYHGPRSKPLVHGHFWTRVWWVAHVLGVSGVLVTFFLLILPNVIYILLKIKRKIDNRFIAKTRI